MKKVSLTSEDKIILTEAMNSVQGADRGTLKRIDKIDEIVNQEGELVSLDDEDFNFLVSMFEGCNKWLSTRDVRKKIALVGDKLDEAKK